MQKSSEVGTLIIIHPSMSHIFIQKIHTVSSLSFSNLNICQKCMEIFIVCKIQLTVTNNF